MPNKDATGPKGKGPKTGRLGGKPAPREGQGQRPRSGGGRNRTRR